MFRLALNADGTAVRGDPTRHVTTTNRYRDVLVSPDGRTIYIATDSSGPTRGANGAMTFTLANPGSILVFTAQP